MREYLTYEQYDVIVQETVTNLGIALCAVLAITLLLIASVRCSMLVMLCILLVDVDVLGLMWLWGLTINSISIINLVLAVGLSLDYSCHIAQAFLTARGTREQRAQKASFALTHTPILPRCHTPILPIYLSRPFFLSRPSKRWVRPSSMGPRPPSSRSLCSPAQSPSSSRSSTSFFCLPLFPICRTPFPPHVRN